jgi:hypothetical protein
MKKSILAFRIILIDSFCIFALTLVFHQEINREPCVNQGLYPQL